MRMVNKYSVAQYSVDNILGFINSGEISIPEIQRPFVWKPKNVRDLVDSLYNGYPTGYLIIWQNPSVRLKDGREAGGTKILIDGQQRVTALMTALAGKLILTENYETKAYKIAFNPLAKDGEERFAVQTPAHVKSKNWIPDISVVFKPNFNSFNFINEYIQNNPEISSDIINSEIQKLSDIRMCQMGAITLNQDLDINEVTEIFVRINSQGKRLNASDFAMSKIAADSRYGGNVLRKAIDYFCHLAVDPHFYKISTTDDEFMSSEYAGLLKWRKDDIEAIYVPDYNDMLRVCLMSEFKRGKLGDLVSLLSGRDFEERTYKEVIAKDSFETLTSGVKKFINKYNFQNFVLTIKSCGFISEKLLNSKMTLDFAYTLYLILNNSKDVEKSEINRLVQKWFIMSTLTSRYISSPESQMDKDLRSITSEKGFKGYFKEVEEAELSDSFWNVALVQNLETSSINSPYFNTYIAAQVRNAEQSLFSNTTKVSDLIAVTGDVHHIFPKEYLRQNGYEDKSEYNQVANYTYLDTRVNISIGKKAPYEYFTKAKEQCIDGECRIGTILNEDEFYRNLEINCIPATILNMQACDYDKFLHDRRKMMAEKIRKYYYSI